MVPAPHFQEWLNDPDQIKLVSDAANAADMKDVLVLYLPQYTAKRVATARGS